MDHGNAVANVVEAAWIIQEFCKKTGCEWGCPFAQLGVVFWECGLEGANPLAWRLCEEEAHGTKNTTGICADE